MKFFTKIFTKEYYKKIKLRIANYYKELFSNKKRLAIRYGTSLATMFMIFLIAFILRAHYIQSTFNNTNLSPIVVANRGISFGALQGQSVLVYFLQTLPVFFSFIAMIHSKGVIFSFGIALIFASGLSNLADRIDPDYLGTQIPGSQPYDQNGNLFVAYDAVIDYWQSPGSSAIYNFPDVFIITGIVIVFIYSFITGWIEGNKKIREEEEQERLAAAKTGAADPTLNPKT